MSTRGGLILVAVFGVVGLAAPSAYGAPADAAGVYSAAQAARGKALYAQTCSACHADNLAGMDVAPPLVGPRFMDNWRGQSVADLARRIRTTMPLDNPGSLGVGASLDVTAYLLEANGFPSGPTDLPRDTPSLSKLPMERSAP